MFEKYMLKCCNAKHKARGWHRNCEQSNTNDNDNVEHKRHVKCDVKLE